MKKCIFYILGLMCCSVFSMAADYLEIKGLDDAKVEFKDGVAILVKLRPLPIVEKGKTETAWKDSGYYIGARFSAEIKDGKFRGVIVGADLDGFLEIGNLGDERLTPIISTFEKAFSIGKPSLEWTKVKIDKHKSYEIRWIRVSNK